MHDLRTEYEKGCVRKELIYTSLKAYSSSCAEMRSEAIFAYALVNDEDIAVQSYT